MDKIPGDPNLLQRMIGVASTRVGDVRRQKDLQPETFNPQDQVIFQEPLSPKDIASALLKSMAANQIRKLKGKFQNDDEERDKKIREEAEKICGSELSNDQFEEIKKLVLQALETPENLVEVSGRNGLELKLDYHGIMPIIDSENQPIKEE